MLRALVVLALSLGITTQAAAQAASADSVQRGPLARAAMTGIQVAPVAALAYFVTPKLPDEKFAGRDKLLHGTVAFAATSVLVDVGVSPATSGILVCVAAGGWEVMQGEVSKYDIAAGCGSALVASVWRAAWSGQRSSR